MFEGEFGNEKVLECDDHMRWIYVYRFIDPTEYL